MWLSKVHFVALWGVYVCIHFSQSVIHFICVQALPPDSVREQYLEALGAFQVRGKSSVALVFLVYLRFFSLFTQTAA